MCYGRLPQKALAYLVLGITVVARLALFSLLVLAKLHPATWRARGRVRSAGIRGDMAVSPRRRKD